MAYRINKSEIEEVRKVYLAYKKAYKKQKIKEIKEIKDTIENTKRHVKGKFAREDEYMKKFVDTPTSVNFGRICISIFGPNEGNRYEHIKKILKRFDKIENKIDSR